MSIRQTSFTAQVARWEKLAEALGGIRVVNDGPWQVFALGGGRLAIHDVEPSDPKNGTCSIALDVPDLDEFFARVTPQGGKLTVGDVGHGRAITATSPSLPSFFIDTREGEQAHAGDTLIAPLFYTPDVAEGAHFLASLGLAPRLSSDAGTYVDFVDDGVVAIHVGELGCGPGFEHGDVTALVEPLRSAGFRVTLIDESYGRTLRVENPDNPAVEAEIWINETQSDTYGFSEGFPA